MAVEDANGRPVGVSLARGLEIDLERGLAAWAVHREMYHLPRRAQHHLLEQIGVAQVTLAVDRHDLIARAQAGFVCRRSRTHKPEHRRLLEARVRIVKREARVGEQDVHDHPGRDDRHPRAHRFVGISAGVGRLARLVFRAFAEHLDKAAQGQGRDHVIGLSAPETEERRPEADREFLDLHSVPLGHQEVAELMDENHHPQAHGDLHRREKRIQALQLSTSCRAHTSTSHKSSSVGIGSYV